MDQAREVSGSDVHKLTLKSASRAVPGFASVLGQRNSSALWGLVRASCFSQRTSPEAMSCNRSRMSQGNHQGGEEKKKKEGTRSQLFTLLSSYRACKGNQGRAKALLISPWVTGWLLLLFSLGE